MVEQVIKVNRKKLLKALYWLLTLNILMILKYDSMNAGSARFWTTIVPVCDIVYMLALYISDDKPDDRMQI